MKAYNDCIILYDLSMLLTYFVTCYRNNTIELLGIEEQNLMISQKIVGGAVRDYDELIPLIMGYDSSMVRWM